ncbi:MAG: hypothetical protein WAN11_20550 [Syntrophobacteraceae bacterium]
MYNDEKSYQFHEKDRVDRCFACSENSERLLILRHIKSMKLVHLCRNCMVENIEDYLLDNTKPWTLTPDESGG